MKKELKKNISWSFLGNSLYSFSQWTVILFLTKFSTPEILGKYSFSLAVISPIFMFSSFQLKAQFASDAKNQFGAAEYFSQRLSLVVLASVISIAFFIHKNDSFLFSLAVFLVFQKLFDGFSDIAYGYYVKNSLLDRLGVSLILKSLLITMGAFITIKVLPLGAFFSVSLFVASLLTLFLYDRRKADGVFKVSFKYLFNYRLLKKVFPLGVIMGVISLNSNFQKYLIESFLGYEQLGVFAALTYFLVFGSLLYRAIVDGVFPYFVKYYNNGEIKKFWKLYYGFSGVVIILSFAFVLVSLFAGETVLRFFYSDEYAKYQNVLLYISYASFPIYLNAVLGSCLTSIQKYNIQIYGVTINLVFGVIFGLYFIPLYGVVGAVYAMIGGAALHFVLFFIFLKRYLDAKDKSTSHT